MAGSASQLDLPPLLIMEVIMRLRTEPITQQSRFWGRVNDLAKEAFPPEEYLAPSELVKMAHAENFELSLIHI